MVDPDLDAHARGGRGRVPSASRSSRPSSIATILNHDSLEAAVVHRIATRLDHPDVSGELIRAGLCGCARGRPVDRRGVPRRHRGDRRPRSGDAPLHRAGALFQGLPRHPDASPRALALEQGPHAISRSICRAAPRRCSRCDIHPAARDRPRHLPRPRHRPRGRRDRGHRRRRLDPAGRDARRHRQGERATAIRRSAAA